MNQFAIDRGNGVLLIAFEGPVTAESLGALDNDVKSFLAKESPMAAVIDFTGASSVAIGPSVAIERGRRERQMPGMPRVFVTTNPLLFGILRVFAAHQDIVGEKPPLVVRTLAEAFQALGVVDPAFEPITVE